MQKQNAVKPAVITEHPWDHSQESTAVSVLFIEGFIVAKCHCLAVASRDNN